MIFVALRTDVENTPLQIKLNILAELIAKVGSISGLVLFLALMIKFIVQLCTNRSSQYVSVSISQLFFLLIG